MGGDLLKLPKVRQDESRSDRWKLHHIYYSGACYKINWAHPARHVKYFSLHHIFTGLLYKNILHWTNDEPNELISHILLFSTPLFLVTF